MYCFCPTSRRIAQAFHGDEVASNHSSTTYKHRLVGCFVVRLPSLGPSVCGYSSEKLKSQVFESDLHTGIMHTLFTRSVL